MRTIDDSNLFALSDELERAVSDVLAATDHEQSLWPAFFGEVGKLAPPWLPEDQDDWDREDAAVYGEAYLRIARETEIGAALCRACKAVERACDRTDAISKKIMAMTPGTKAERALIERARAVNEGDSLGEQSALY